jgi:hypothetical protein
MDLIMLVHSIVRSAAGLGSRPLFLLFDLTAAVDDEPHILAVLHRFGGRALGGRLEVADLRLAGCLDPGDEFLLRQGMSG